MNTTVINDDALLIRNFIRPSCRDLSNFLGYCINRHLQLRGFPEYHMVGKQEVPVPAYWWQDTF
jgi:hypothetical protein